MPLGEVHDVDVVSHPRTVRGAVIVSEDAQVIPTTHANLVYGNTRPPFEKEK